MTTQAQRKALGDFGERSAAQFLIGIGMVVLDRNWRCTAGEIDIVALDGTDLVVCEVKTRSSTRFGTPLEAITPAKAARLHRLGRRWALLHRGQVPFDTMRIDVVCVDAGSRGAPAIEHVRAVA